MISLIINTEPKPLKRARTAVRNNFVSTYYNKSDKEEMEELRYKIIKAVKELPKYQQDLINENKGKPISLHLAFYMSLPKSYSNKKKQALVNKGHTNLPDLDNLIKNVLDRGDGILWNNDKTIYSIRAEKIWSIEPAIVISISYE